LSRNKVVAGFSQLGTWI